MITEHYVNFFMNRSLISSPQTDHGIVLVSSTKVDVEEQSEED